MSIQLQRHLTFLAVDDRDGALTFYRDILGLTFVGDEMGTLVFDLDGTPLRISTLADFPPQTFTVLGWDVTDIEAAVATLADAGVDPIRYPNMPQDDAGIATLGPVRIFWFKDPASNVLSLTEE